MGRCGEGERRREAESGGGVSFCRRKEDRHGELRHTDGERVKWRSCECEMFTPPSGRDTGSLLTGMSNHPRIATEGQEDRLTDTH